jgi:hypothetical protein
MQPQIYRIPASSSWQVRLFVGRKYLRKSTKCEGEREAIEFAKRFYDEVKIAQRLDFDVHRDTIAACAQISQFLPLYSLTRPHDPPNRNTTDDIPKSTLAASSASDITSPTREA